VEPKPDSYGTRWRTAHGDLTDEEWERIADLVAAYSGEGRMGRPAGHDTRDVVNAISDVAATGCQWRAPDVRPAVEHRAPLPPAVVSGRHLDADLRSPPPPRSEADGRDAEVSAGGVDAQSVREHRRSPRREGRRGREDGLGTPTFGVDTLGLLVAVVVVVASMSDDVGGIAAVDRARPTSTRPSKISCDTGFTRAFGSHCGAHHISAEWRGRSTPGPSRCSAGARWGSGRGPR